MNENFSEDLDNALAVLNRGGVILYPTDTVWGIGCDATDSNAVSRVYTIKQRTDNKAMLILVDSIASLERCVDEIPSIAYELIEVSDRPMTIIYPKAKNLAHNLPAEDGSAGIRVTTEQFSKKLCEKFGKPIVSTSANISGKPSPSKFKDISDDIKCNVDYIVHYRQNDKQNAVPSSIIRLERNNTFKIIRK